MKKKFLAILLTASLLVGIMAAAAAASTTYGLKYLAGSSGVTFTGNSATTYAALVSLDKGASAKTYTFTVQLAASANEKNDVTPQLSVPSNSGITWSYSPAKFAWASDLGNATSNGWATSFSNNTKGEGTVSITFSKTGVYTVTPKVLDNDGTAADTASGNSLSWSVKFTVVEAAPPAFDDGVADSGTDIGEKYNTTDKVIYAGNSISQSDSDNLTDFAKWKASTTNDPSKFHLRGTITPGGSGLEFVGDQGIASVASNKYLEGYISGDAANVDVDTKYTLTVTAEDDIDSVSRTYPFWIYAKPKFDTSKKPTDIVWGVDNWSFTPSVSNCDALDIDTSDYVQAASTDYLIKTDFASGQAGAGLTFTASSGSGTLAGRWRPAVAETKIFNAAGASGWDGSDQSRKIVVVATRGTDASKKATTTQEYTLKFVGSVPTFEKSVADYTAAFGDIDWKYNVNEAGGVTISVDAPGVIPATVSTTAAAGKKSPGWTVLNLPDGLAANATATTGGYKAKIEIKGTPNTTCNNQKISITATNEKGDSVTIEPTISITSDTFYLRLEASSNDATQATHDNALPGGTTSNQNAKKAKVGQSSGTIKLLAFPGPVAWSTANLPAGLTLKVDESDSRKATLSGTYTGARASTKDTDIHYSITAKNNVVAKEATLSQDLMVWDIPKITNDFVFAKGNSIKTKTAYRTEISATNLPDSADWTVTIGGAAQKAAGSAPAGAGYAVDSGASKISID
ncbi:MAG: hypothetical protein IJP53_02020, partial [Synergistaceae bacterium]|nr:hypothetical protein [Synergistaceae bacterium]